MLQSHITTGLQMIVRQISNNHMNAIRLAYNHFKTILIDSLKGLSKIDEDHHRTTIIQPTCKLLNV